MKNLVIVWLLVLGAWNFTPCYAGDIKSSFYMANSLYEQANYDEAIKQYNSILEGGLESGNLYYNLGNCYFKKEELGEALFYYEKARRLIPSDRDLESNYEYARSLIKGGGIAYKKGWFSKAWNGIFERFTIDGLTVFLSVCYLFILCSVLIGSLFGPFRKYTLPMLVFFGFFFIIGFAGFRGKIGLLNKEAVVTAEQVDARFEPLDNATTHFTLYEGMKVAIVGSKDSWYKVRRQDNKAGWVRDLALLKLN